MDPQYVEHKKDEEAQQMFGKPFDELEAHDRVRVGGKVGFGGLEDASCVLRCLRDSCLLPLT